uniref:Uncharacterized protein n=1 Tax=Aegilops tauschii TaxID=37682 RepID=N1QQV9_AEGTA
MAVLVGGLTLDLRAAVSVSRRQEQQQRHIGNVVHLAGVVSKTCISVLAHSPFSCR